MPSSKPNPGDNISRVERGRRFEQLAAQFYVSNGYVVLERNWRAGHKEIDLIVRKDDQIAFVEVKASFSKKFGHPVERVDRRKVQNLVACAQQYVNAKELTGVDLRFDVVTFDNGKLEHYPDAFQAEN